MSGAAGDGASWTALIADLDQDGALEIYVVNDQFVVDEFPPMTSIDPDAWLDRVSLDGRGVPAYVDRTASKGTDGPRSGMGAALIDANGDGWDDIFVTNWGTNLFQVYEPTTDYDHQQTAWNLDQRLTPEGYRFISWGTRFVDLDRDGSSEVLIVNGHIYPPMNCTALAQMDQFLRRHPGNDVFDNITPQVGLPWHHDCNTSKPQLPFGGRGVAIGDLDGDGDDDLVVTPYIEAYRVYRNDTPSLHHRLRARLRGTVSSPHPVGAVLEVTRLDGKVIRKVLYAGGETQTQSPWVLEVGLATATSVTSAWIRWPSGFDQRIDTLPSFAVDTELELVEPEWLSLSARVVASSDPVPVLTYHALADDGTPLGPAGEGRTVVVTRSDGVAATMIDAGGGVYRAALPHPGSARITVLTVEVDGVEQRPRLTVRYQ